MTDTLAPRPVIGVMAPAMNTVVQPELESGIEAICQVGTAVPVVAELASLEAASGPTPPWARPDRPRRSRRVGSDGVDHRTRRPGAALSAGP